MRLLFFFLGVFFCHIGFSQVSDPFHMNFQAIVINGNNQLVSNTTVGVRASILKDSINGSPVYVELHQEATDSKGIVNLEIGAGNVQTGALDSIRWSAEPYYFKIEIDSNGGNTYSITNISKMLSVPYSLHTKYVEQEIDSTFNASLASNITAGDTLKWENKQSALVAGENIQISGDTISVKISQSEPETFYIGKDTLGGIIFHLFYDSLDQPHGLVLNKKDSSLYWDKEISLINANSTYDGANNTALMANCKDSQAKDYIDWLNSNSDSGYNDWYIPAIDQLYYFSENKLILEEKLRNTDYPLQVFTSYISSTETDVITVLGWDLINDRPNGFSKLSNILTRAIRSF